MMASLFPNVINGRIVHRDTYEMLAGMSLVEIEQFKAAHSGYGALVAAADLILEWRASH